MNSPLKCWCTNAAWSNSLFIILLTKFYIENLTEHKFYDMPLSIDISSCIIDWVQRLSIVVSSSLETGSIMFYQIESDLLAVSYDELWWRHLPGPRGQSSQTPDGAGYSLDTARDICISPEVRPASISAHDHIKSARISCFSPVWLPRSGLQMSGDSDATQF